MPSQSLARILGDLDEQYGKLARPIPRNPFEWIVWENVAYLVNDERRERAYRTLEKRVGLTAKAIAKAPRAQLLEVAKLGGMHPEARVAKLLEIAELALEQASADLAHVVDLPVKEARRVLEQFPGIGGPGAAKILLLCGGEASLALDSNALRVALRLGYGAETKSYAATYRSALEALGPHLPKDRAGLVRVHELLRMHGKSLCKRNGPDCSACPLTDRCRYFALEG